MTEKEKRDEIIKMREKFYELLENIDLDEITLLAKWEIEKDLESLKKSRSIAHDLEEYSLYERLINNREKQLKEIKEILQWNEQKANSTQ